MDSVTLNGTSDYYEILNVPRNVQATAVEIKNAYLKLCLAFHPDKQTDSSLKLASQRIFNTIHTAYTVLSNTQQREIYDQHGLEGIEAAWQLGPHLSETDKLLEEIERRKRVGGLLNGEVTLVKSVLTVGLDCSEVVDDIVEADPLVYSDFLPKVTTVGVSETFEGSFDADNFISATLTSTSLAGNSGAGNVVVNLRRPLLSSVQDNTTLTRFVPASLLNRVRYDGSLGFGSRKFVSSALIYQHDKSLTASAQIVGVLQGGSVFPQFTCAASRVFGDNRLVGSLQYTMNSLAFENAGNLALTVTSKTGPEVASPWTLAALFNDTGLNVEVKKTLCINEKNELRVKLGMNRNLSSVVAVGAHHRWTPQARGSAAVRLDSEAGISLRFGLTHKKLNFILPIQFSHEFSPAALIVACVIPPLCTFLFTSYVQPAILKRQKDLFWSEYRRKRAALMERRREEAEMTVQLMHAVLEKRTAGHDPEDALKVVEAVYRSIDKAETWNVTIPLQFLVNNAHLHLDSSYRANVLGFFDVAVGKQKETWIKYKFKGRMHEATFLDDQSITIPMKEHLVDDK